MPLEAFVSRSWEWGTPNASPPAVFLGGPCRLLLCLQLLLELLLEAVCFLSVVFAEFMLLPQVLLVKGHHLLQPVIVLTAACRGQR